MFFKLFRHAGCPAGWDGRHLLAAEVMLGSCIASQAADYRALATPASLRERLLADYTLLLHHADDVPYLADEAFNNEIAQGIETFLDEAAPELLVNIAHATSLDPESEMEALLISMREDPQFAEFCRRRGGGAA